MKVIYLDDSDSYIKMCAEAQELQISKHKDGSLDPGDFFWNGSEVCVAGMDYVEVKKYYDDDFKTAIYEFAMLDEPIDFTLVDRYVVIHKGEYILKKYHHPIWLPRLDQLFDMINFVAAHNRDKISLFNDWHGKHEELWYMSMEQIILCYAMELQFNKEWDFAEQKWKVI